ncbi:MAG: hypothetical protein QOC85_708, partial [Streptomyces sp.]|nr:hypothetical protein [Streptomyces sp.]
ERVAVRLADLGGSGFSMCAGYFAT